MRNRLFRPFVLSILLAFMLASVPANAAPRVANGWLERDFPFISKIIKEIVKRTHERVTANADGLTVPKP